MGAWIKINSTPQFSGDRPAAGFEALVIAHVRGARKRCHGGGRPALWHYPIVGGKQKRHHMTEKPVGLMEVLIRDFTDRGEIICDPYAGSGSTGVAAIQTGRRFVGWELSRDDHRTAGRRLTRAKEQLDLFERVARRRNRGRQVRVATALELPL